MQSTTSTGALAGLAGLALMMTLMSPASQAVPLLPGNSVFLPGTTAAARPELGGLVVHDSIESELVIENLLTFFGYAYQNRAVRSDVTNTTIISPRLRDPTNVSGGDLLLDGFSVTGYSGWATDVDYRTDSLGDRGPTFVERSADGDTLTFTFGFPLFSGNLFQEIHEESFFINILTDAPTFALTGTATLMQRNLDYPGETFAIALDGIAVPSAVGTVPSPLPLALLLTGCSALLLKRMPGR